MNEEPSKELPETFEELAKWFEHFLKLAGVAAECGAESVQELTRRIAYYQGYMDATQLAHEPGEECLANGRLRLGIEVDAIDKSTKHIRRNGPTVPDAFDEFLDLLARYREMVDDIARISNNDTYATTLKLEVARFEGYREAMSLSGHDPALIIHGLIRLRDAIRIFKRGIGK